MRTFITKSLINKHADCGVRYIEIDKTTVVTSDAYDQARRRSVVIKLVEQAPCHMNGSTACTLEQRLAIHTQVRSAVIAQLGFEPDKIDHVITAVLSRMKI